MRNLVQKLTIYLTRSVLYVFMGSRNLFYF